MTQPQSRKLPSKDQVLDLMLKRCATTCNPKGGCGGVCKREIETFTIDAIIQATAELYQRSETGPSLEQIARFIEGDAQLSKADALRVANMVRDLRHGSWTAQVEGMLYKAADRIEELERKLAVAEEQATLRGLGVSASSSCAATVPAGWKLVPVNATPEMKLAAWDAMKNIPRNGVRRLHFDTVWAAFIAFAPVPESGATKNAAGQVPGVSDAPVNPISSSPDPAAPPQPEAPTPIQSLVDEVTGMCSCSEGFSSRGLADPYCCPCNCAGAIKDAIERAVREDLASRSASAARCPLGLDDTPTICSAATCVSCKAWREYIARSSTTEPEGYPGIAADCETMREALRMIAGQIPCPDDLLGNSDIARIALEKLTRSATESRNNQQEK